jgi:hypothetical protein
MMPMQPGPTGPPPASGPPGGPPGQGGGQMPPQQAQQILGKLGIGPDMLPMVMAACETMMMASQGAEQQAPPQGGGLMQALSSRYQEPAA